MTTWPLMTTKTTTTMMPAVPWQSSRRACGTRRLGPPACGTARTGGPRPPTLWRVMVSYRAPALPRPRKGPYPRTLYINLLILYIAPLTRAARRASGITLLSTPQKVRTRRTAPPRNWPPAFMFGHRPGWGTRQPALPPQLPPNPNNFLLRPYVYTTLRGTPNLNLLMLNFYLTSCPIKPPSL